MHATYDLVSDHGVVGHFTKFFGVQRGGFSEQAFVHGNFADVVQITGGAQGSDVVGFHAHGLSDGGGVASHPQRVAVNVDVLHIDGGGESLERGVIETVERFCESTWFWLAIAT